MKTYVVEIVRRTRVRIEQSEDVENFIDAEQAVERMYNKGDVCAKLGSPEFFCVAIQSDEGKEVTLREHTWVKSS